MESVQIASLILLLELLLIAILLCNSGGGSSRRRYDEPTLPRRTSLSPEALDIIRSCARMEGQIDTIGRLAERRTRDAQWTRTRYF